MKVWITKYALTDGIKEIEAEDAGDGFVRNGHNYFNGEGKEWHRDLVSAKERARVMVAERIASLDKQRSRLLRLVF